MEGRHGVVMEEEPQPPLLLLGTANSDCRPQLTAYLVSHDKAEEGRAKLRPCLPYSWFVTAYGFVMVSGTQLLTMRLPTGPAFILTFLVCVVPEDQAA